MQLKNVDIELSPNGELTLFQQIGDRYNGQKRQAQIIKLADPTPIRQAMNLMGARA